MKTMAKAVGVLLAVAFLAGLWHERDGHDRVTFTFQGSAPGWRVRYVPRVAGDGGRVVALDGEAFLEVTFEPARARDTAGRPTFADGDLGPGAISVRQVRLAGDFEGRVRFGIGVAGRDGFRVVEQRAPTRVAVDVREAPARARAGPPAQPVTASSASLGFWPPKRVAGIRRRTA